jgi:hypothetical protein
MRLFTTSRCAAAPTKPRARHLRILPCLNLFLLCLTPEHASLSERQRLVRALDVQIFATPATSTIGDNGVHGSR